MKPFHYQLPLPDTCKQYPQIQFENERVLDPADCQPQLAYLQSILERLCATPSCNTPAGDITLLISDMDEINGAVALHGDGKYTIFVTKGALFKLASEDELAFLIAHELGHPELRKRYGDGARSDNIPSRIHETGADGWAAVFMTEADYNWQAAETLIKRLPSSQRYLHIFDAHGRKTDRIKIVYDVLGARGLINQTELSEKTETAIAVEILDENFAAAKHTSFIDAYKAHVGWDDLGSIERLNALLQLQRNELQTGAYRANEYLDELRASAHLIHQQGLIPSDEALHEAARRSAGLIDTQPFISLHDHSRWHTIPYGKGISGFMRRLPGLKQPGRSICCFYRHWGHFAI